MNIRRSSGALSEANADALLAGRALAGHDDLREIIGLMKTASTVAAPTPNAALAAVLDTGFAPLPVGSAERGSCWGCWGCWGVRIGVATAAAMTVTFGAAAANALPAPLQTAVANVVGAVTPLQLPRPAARHDNGSTERGGASDDPAGGPGPDTDAGLQESTTEPAEVTPTAPAAAPPPPKAPAVVAPPRRPRATATTPAERDEPDADEPDAEADEPEAPDAGAGYFDDQDVLQADEPELDVDGQPKQDTHEDD